MIFFSACEHFQIRKNSFSTYLIKFQIHSYALKCQNERSVSAKMPLNIRTRLLDAMNLSCSMHINIRQTKNRLGMVLM